MTMQNETGLEQLSALADDELPTARRTRAIDALAGDDAMRERWRNYHVIGAAMRGELAETPDVSAAVKASIAAEPVEFAPAARKRALRPVTGLAIAASVAAAAVLGLRLFLGGGDVVQGPGFDVAQSAPQPAPATVVGNNLVPSPGAGIVVRPVNGPQQVVAERPFVIPANTRAGDATTLPAMGQARNERLNRYLVNHAGSMRSGVRGLMPYPVIVSHQER